MAKFTACKPRPEDPSFLVNLECNSEETIESITISIIIHHSPLWQNKILYNKEAAGPGKRPLSRDIAKYLQRGTAFCFHTFHLASTTTPCLTLLPHHHTNNDV